MNNFYILNLEDTIMVIKNFFSDYKYLLIISGAILILSILLVSLKPKKKKEKIYDKPHNDPLLINQNEIASKEILEKMAFEKLKEIKTAKMNFDLETIKKITTDDIFELYDRQINTLKKNKQQNLIQNIKYLKSYVTNLNTNSNTANLRVIIECYDFVIDSNNKCIKGKYNQKVMQTYEIEIKFDAKFENCIIQKLELLYENEI